MVNAYQLKNWLKKVLRKPWKDLKRLPGKMKLIAAREANRLLPFVSIERERLFPPEKSSKSTVRWFSQVGESMNVDLRLVDVAYTAINRVPKTTYEHPRQQLLMDQAYPCPQTFVASIPRGLVLGDGLVITPDHQLLEDVSVDFRGPEETKLQNISRDWSLEPIKNFDGTVAVLATAGAGIYYHWLFQLLPRLDLIRRAGIDLARIDYFLFNPIVAPFQRESLELLEIDESKILQSSAVHYLRARNLVVPSVPLWGGCFAPWMCEFLRRTFLSRSGQPMRSFARRLYVSRGQAKYRRILNEGDVMEFLQGIGFEVLLFENMTMREQAAAMASCDVIVAPHGGGLSNLVFCSPGTKVIEIFSPELVAGYFWKISNQLDLDYYYMLGTGPAAITDPNYTQAWDTHTDIEVDLDTLKKTLVMADVN